MRAGRGPAQGSRGQPCCASEELVQQRPADPGDGAGDLHHPGHPAALSAAVTGHPAETPGLRPRHAHAGRPARDTSSSTPPDSGTRPNRKPPAARDHLQPRTTPTRAGVFILAMRERRPFLVNDIRAIEPDPCGQEPRIRSPAGHARAHLRARSCTKKKPLGVPRRSTTAPPTRAAAPERHEPPARPGLAAGDQHRQRDSLRAGAGEREKVPRAGRRPPAASSCASTPGAGSPS
ncbi:MAG: hypothetical protein MZV70_21905 [Desulfobacterales bacterium]|nr:hypothetical protein [Desulfobacterales bacterium]